MWWVFFHTCLDVMLICILNMQYSIFLTAHSIQYTVHTTHKNGLQWMSCCAASATNHNLFSFFLNTTCCLVTSNHSHLNLYEPIPSFNFLLSFRIIDDPCWLKCKKKKNVFWQMTCGLRIALKIQLRLFVKCFLLSKIFMCISLLLFFIFNFCQCVEIFCQCKFYVNESEIMRNASSSNIQ